MSEARASCKFDDRSSCDLVQRGLDSLDRQGQESKGLDPKETEDGLADRQTEGEIDRKVLGARKITTPVARAPFRTPRRGTTLVT